MLEFRRLTRSLSVLAAILGLQGGLIRDAAAADYHFARTPYPTAGINDHGTMILNCPCGPGGFSVAFVSTGKQRQPRQLIPPGFNPNVDDITAVAINNQDQVLVHNNHTTTGTQLYFIYDLRSNSYRPIGLRGQFPDRPKIAGMRLGPIIGLTDAGEILARYGAILYGPGALGFVDISGWVYGRPALGAPSETVPPQEPADYTLVPAINCGGRASIVAMNAHHQFAGNCAFGRYVHGMVQKGFLYSGGQLTDVIAPSSVTTTISGISADGRIVGEFQPQHTSSTRAFVFDGGAYTMLETGGVYAFGLGVNSSGQVVGYLKAHVIQGYLASPGRAEAHEAASATTAAPALGAAKPAATTSPAQPPHGYIGSNALIHGTVLTFTVRDPNGPRNGQSISIGGLLPLTGAAPGAPGTSAMYITRQRGQYLAVQMVGNGVVSVVPIKNQKAGEQAYAQARQFESMRHP